MIIQSKVNFIKQYSFFSEWNTSKMLSLWELLKLQKFPRNHIIYKEGDNSTCIFFVKEGEIEVVFLKKENSNKYSDFKILRNF